MTEDDLESEYTALKAEIAQLKDELPNLQHEFSGQPNLAEPDGEDVGIPTERYPTARDIIRSKLKRLQAVKSRLNSLRFERELQMGSSPGE